MQRPCIMPVSSINVEFAIKTSTSEPVMVAIFEFIKFNEPEIDYTLS